MESIYNLDYQNSSLENKIVIGFDRISQVFKTLLIEESKHYNLSPIQIQLLIFINYHSENKSTISYLSKEFNLSKPTVSETIKTLEKKKYITKISDKFDTRSYFIQITDLGKSIVQQTEQYVNPLVNIISNISEANKVMLWQSITNIINELNNIQLINSHRTCTNCQFYSQNNNIPYCALLNQVLKIEDIRIDCPEFK
ncbi:MarR family transcriptional regulator [Flavobacterium sp. Fl-77]|uniref:MarR family transcriptional regulator n=1 Tax=Flavobacterium flavipigmentatum TaxID=2893884 RepID=A0AAJ2VWZ5_9FLAO|nr:MULTISPECIES: MarR family transcriptional regulator [unclassified Flavobacterium]MDX6182419.1 MarR family transcriptional regulator [Flavobacterium sp. Fl-33]MDX6185668.1 MarR family transcriptional regulator [Flavobacterium sp. Fl-77]UFH38853.1 MarR family transcriptional regulator [Flavobacterium sp. F-70]